MKNPKSKIQNPKSGFTVIEAVVATSVFAFVIVSVLGVYLSALQLDKKTRSQRAVAQSARFIMEYLAKEVRNGSINYSSFPGSIAPADCTPAAACQDLYIKNLASEIEHIYRSGDNLVLTKDAGSPSNLNPAGVKVTNLKFYVRPAGDPFTAAKNYNDQPYVTVVLELTSNYGAQQIDIAKMNLQTTLTERSYPLRTP